MRDEDFICVRHKLERQFSSLSYGSMFVFSPSSRCVETKQVARFGRVI